MSEEIRALVRGMATENSSWGAPKIHGELQKLGFEISERTIARHLQRLRRRGDPAKHWLAFLANHRELIVAFDFFTVPTLTFPAAILLLRNRPPTEAHECSSTVAKRSRRTPGSKHPQRTTRPCNSAQRTPPATPGARLPLLLPSGSYPRGVK